MPPGMLPGAGNGAGRKSGRPPKSASVKAGGIRPEKAWDPLLRQRRDHEGEVVPFRRGCRSPGIAAHACEADSGAARFAGEVGGEVAKWSGGNAARKIAGGDKSPRALGRPPHCGDYGRQPRALCACCKRSAGGPSACAGLTLARRLDTPCRSMPLVLRAAQGDAPDAPPGIWALAAPVDRTEPNRHATRLGGVPVWVRSPK